MGTRGPRGQEAGSRPLTVWAGLPLGVWGLWSPSLRCVVMETLGGEAAKASPVGLLAPGDVGESHGCSPRPLCPRATSSPGKMSGGQPCSSPLGEGLLLASGGWGLGRLLNTLQGPGRPTSESPQGFLSGCKAGKYQPCVRVSVFLSHPSVCLSSLHPSINCLCIYLFIHPSSMHPSLYVSVYCPPIHPSSICLYICLSQRSAPRDDSAVQRHPVPTQSSIFHTSRRNTLSVL